jgi:phosphoribosyl 1,2-cyclic phosphate phosphodiesterase
MQQVKVTVLGTGTSTGVPMVACNCEVCKSSNIKDKRLRCSILIQSASTTIVIDTTPDFRQQMLQHNIQKLDAVVFTHPHKDHIAGLDDVKAFNFFQQQPMPVYANELTQVAIKREFYYVFTEEKYPGIPQLELQRIDEKNEIIIGDITLTPILVWHLKMPVLGFRIGDFTYITDANNIEAQELQKIIGSKILILNALRKEEHISHFNLQQAIDLSKQLKVPQTYFTHISHQMGLHENVNNLLPNGCALAYDGLELEVQIQ